MGGCDVPQVDERLVENIQAVERLVCVVVFIRNHK